MTTEINGKQVLENRDGLFVPVEKIKPQDLLTDSVVKALAAEAIVINETLADFKRRALADIADLISIAGEKYGVELGGKKGNISLTSFNGNYRIERKMSDNVTFTAELFAAKELVDQCVDGWSEGANDNYKLLVDNVFKVNKNGSLSTVEIFKMLRWNITDPKWQSAMQAVSDSILVSGTTVYINIYVRDAETGKYNSVPMSLSGV